MGVRRLSNVRVPLVRAVSASVIALAAAACSGDSNRFADNPFSNPFASSRVDTTPTGTIPNKVASAPAVSAPTTRVATAQLPPPPSVPVAGQNVVNRPGAGVNAAVTGFNANGWTATGGSSVVLAQGETVNALANRYGVPAEAIYKTNGLANGGVVAPGTRLTIPVYRPGGATAEAPKPAAPKHEPKVAEAKPAKVKTANDKKPAKSDKAPKMVAAKPETLKPKAVKPKPAADDDEDDAPAPKAAAKPEPAKPAAKTAEAKPAAPAPANETKIARTEKTEPETTGSLPGANFRWPARGRIISGFKNNGNDGINIAVPEGTPVKAADEGTVAYSGSELKGYGNLVLVRHANGYVSAYAHNGELKVKKGDVVKRGQTIATAGQTGNVSSPQLHFEIRKGSTPVDPTGYLQ